MAQVFGRLPAARVIALGMALFLLAGCGASYARLQINRQIQQDFKAYKRIDDYRYYYSGRENKPSAIIGIDPSFQFGSEYWTAIEPSQFKKMVDRLVAPNYAYLYGADILTPEGKRAGVWYSWVQSFVARVEGNKIVVYSPEAYAEPDGPGLFNDPVGHGK